MNLKYCDKARRLLGPQRENFYFYTWYLVLSFVEYLAVGQTKEGTVTKSFKNLSLKNSNLVQGLVIMIQLY